ncbi:CD27 antigen isoform X2 [Sparus aurata]|nr:CD27 antigen isoform X2 [Sparus aurata]
MQPLFYITFTVLCSLSLLPSGLSIQCNETQYSWPVQQPHLCCDRCPPGTHLRSRHVAKCEIECIPCTDGLFRESFNLEQDCEFCASCKTPNMEFESECNATHNAVCRCKDGYQCREQPCKECEPIPTTTTPVTPTTAPKPLTNPATPSAASKPLGDKVWFLVITALLSAVIALVVVTNSKPILRWMRSKSGCPLTKPYPPVTPCPPDGDVSKPVQEAGNVNNPKMDTGLGLPLISHTDI